MSDDKKYYQEKRLWFRKFLDARERGDRIGQKRAYNKLIELTGGKFNGKNLPK